MLLINRAASQCFATSAVTVINNSLKYHNEQREKFSKVWAEVR